MVTSIQVSGDMVSVLIDNEIEIAIIKCRTGWDISAYPNETDTHVLSRSFVTKGAVQDYKETA